MCVKLLTLVLVLTSPAMASASQIAIGLDWRQNVFVQEFWPDDKARYAIYNGRADAIKLMVNDIQFVSAPGTESFRAVEGKDLAGWEIEGKGVVFVDAPVAPAGNGLRFLTFRIAHGARLGTLTFPAAPGDMPKGKIFSCDGINGSGGRRQKVYYEQDSLAFKSDGIIEVRLKLPAGAETITFKKKKGMDNPVEAIISEAECATLPIQASDKAIVIDTGKPLKAAAVHVVTLRFRAPHADTPTMVVIDGWVALPPSIAGTPGGGYHVIRGVIVQPEK